MQPLTDSSVESAREVIFGDLKGKRMYMEGDELVIEMSYFENGRTDEIYTTITKILEKVLK